MSTAAAPKSRRRYLQFSMRGVLLLTLVAAAISAWLFAPPERARMLGLGAATARERFARIVDPNTGQASLQLSGRWELVDEFGFTRIRGGYAGGLPAGDWTFYDADGNERLTGGVQNGLRAGPWKSRHANGKQESEANYIFGRVTETEYPRNLGAPARPFYSPTLHATRYRDRVLPAREGAINVWWPNGELRQQGAFVQLQSAVPADEASAMVSQPPPPFAPAMNFRAKHSAELGYDIRDGKWTTRDEAGHVTTEGEYQHGVRVGTWRFADGKQTRDVNYAAGLEVDEVAAEVERLAQQVVGPTFRERHQAVWRLMRMGPSAKPLLTAWLEGDNLERRRMAAGALAQFEGDAEIAERLAKSAADQRNPRELRQSILTSLTRMEVRSSSVASVLDRIIEDEASDGDLRAAARLAVVYVAPDRFSQVVGTLLTEVADADESRRDKAFNEFHGLLYWTTESCAEPWHALPRPMRMTIITDLAKRHRKYGAWGWNSLPAEELVPLARNDADSQIREIAATLPPADPPPPKPNGGGSFGFMVPPTRGHRP